jgi:hypothetical protein
VSDEPAGARDERGTQGRDRVRGAGSGHPRDPGDHAAAPPAAPLDDRREVALNEELDILPDQTLDDTDAGWGEPLRGNDDRLLAERPPHWD